MEQDIVNRMNEWLESQPDPSGRTFHPLHPETLIAQAMDEIKRLRAGGCARDQKTTQFCASAFALQKENEHLRIALQRISEYHLSISHGWAEDVRSIARSALWDKK